MKKLLPLFCVVCVPVLWPVLARGVEIRGKVIDIQEDKVMISRDEKQDPSPGDRVEIFFEVPGVDDVVVVGSGKVTEVTDKGIGVRIERALGKVEQGHQARIFSDNPRPRLARQGPLTHDELVGLLKKKTDEEQILKLVGSAQYLAAVDDARREELKMLGASGKILAALERSALLTGVSTGPNLQVARWLTFRPITAFKRVKDTKDPLWITNLKISANGARIIFSGKHNFAGGAAGTFTIEADGNKLVQLSDEVNEGLIDVSAAGDKVVWYSPKDGVTVANSDGSNKRKVFEGFQPAAVQMTAQGDRLFLHKWGDGTIYTLTSGGEDLKVVVKPADAAKAAGPKEDPGAAILSLDCSEDGKRLVFRLGRDAFVVNGDGTGLRNLTNRKADEPVRELCISRDGKKAACYDPKQGIQLFNLDGGATVKLADGDQGVFYGMQCSQDGSRVLLRYRPRLFGSDKSRVDLDDLGDSPVHHDPGLATLSADGRRLCFVDYLRVGEAGQIFVGDFNPPSLRGAPPLRHIEIAPARTLATDGANNAVVSAQTQDPGLAHLAAVLFRDGRRLPQAPTVWLNDKGQAGDERAGDGIFAGNGLRLSFAKVAPGPLTLRLVAANQSGHTLVVEVEGLQAQAP